MQVQECVQFSVLLRPQAETKASQPLVRPLPLRDGENQGIALDLNADSLYRLVSKIRRLGSSARRCFKLISTARLTHKLKTP